MGATVRTVYHSVSGRRDDHDGCDIPLTLVVLPAILVVMPVGDDEIGEGGSHDGWSSQDRGGATRERRGGPGGRGMTYCILVVEDDPDIRGILVSVLGKEYDVHAAADGLAAMMEIEHGLKPDLVIADIMMPQVDGLTLVRALRGRPSTAAIPVVLLTAKGTPRDVIEGISAGARYYMIKPFKMDDLLNKVRQLLPAQRK